MCSIVHVIPTLNQGGAERLLCDLVRNDHLNRHIVIKLFAGSGLFDDDVVGSCAGVYGLGLSRRLPLTLLMLPFALVRLLWLLIVLRPRIVVGWLYYGALATSVSRLLRIPVIWSLHAADFDLETSFKRSTRVAVRWCRALAQLVPGRIQYCSSESRAHHEKLGFPNIKSRVIVNGVDLGRFQLVAAEKTAAPLEISGATLRPGTMVIGSIARFEPQKDHRTLLKAAANLKGAGRQITVVLAGRGCDRTNPELRAMVDEFGLKNEVVPVGILADVDRLIRHCDCIVLSSCEGEAMPLVVLESLALGKPVVATDVGSSAEIVGGFGLTVAPRSHEALSWAIEQVLWINPSYRQAAADRGHAWIVERYSLVRAIECWNNMFAELSADCSPRTMCARPAAPCTFLTRF